MDHVLWESKNKKWQLANWSQRSIAIVGEWRNYEAFRYDDGRIAYDIPEAIPKYVKQAVEKVFAQRFSRERIDNQ